ncbi:unnamed protein product [Protopolystoma xenopodis]|uniref:Uncharacterized protein n=1 Tax=Protopolystoma xenopodis TaxID=117903 RepID=A0A448WL29_9PLAT|nr:unnamed protein product [Protopolystoma xenopodis]
MVSYLDDVGHMTDEGLERIQGRMAVRRGPVHTNIKPQLQGSPPQPPVKPTYESLPLASSNEMNYTPTLIPVT